MWGAKPSGCNVIRSAFAGGSRRWGLTTGPSKDDERVVRGHDVPPAVDDHRGERLVSAQDLVEGLPDGLELVGVERPFAVRRRVARREEQGVALAERDVEVVGEMQHQLPARSRAAGLDEAQMAGGHLRLAGEVELAQAAALAPVTQQIADAGCG